MKLLVIIPAFNEAENLVPVVGNLYKNYPQFDYLVINDGSTDNTAEICRQNGYHVMNLPINLGLTNAIGAGMKYAYKYGYDAAIQFDGDGQHRPEYLQALADKLAEGYDIVTGSRFVDIKKPFTLRMLGSRLISYSIFFTTGQKFTDPTSGYRIYNRRIIREFATQINHSPEPDTISYLIRKGARATEIQVEMDERVSGSSYLTSINSAKYMLGIGISIVLVQWFRGGVLPPLQKDSSDKKEVS